MDYMSLKDSNKSKIDYCSYCLVAVSTLIYGLAILTISNWGNNSLIETADQVSMTECVKQSNIIGKYNDFTYEDYSVNNSAIIVSSLIGIVCSVMIPITIMAVLDNYAAHYTKFQLISRQYVAVLTITFLIILAIYLHLLIPVDNKKRSNILFINNLEQVLEYLISSFGQNINPDLNFYLVLCKSLKYDCISSCPMFVDLYDTITDPNIKF